FHDPYYDMAIPLLRGGHVNGTLWHSNATLIEVLPFLLLASALAAAVAVLSSDSRGSPWRRAAGPVIAVLLVVVQAIWAFKLGYGRTDVLSDVLNKMGYTCDADAMRIQLHERRRTIYDMTQLVLVRISTPCDRLRDVSAAQRLVDQVAHATKDPNAFILDAQAA